VSGWMGLRILAMCPSRSRIMCIARKSGVRYLAAPSGSVMDEECVKAADEHGIVCAYVVEVVSSSVKR